MNPAFFSRRLAKGVYRTTRVIVRALAVLVALAMVSFLFLRIYGIPGPLLREVMRRVHAAGIPVEVDDITLTFHGWRADNVRYYSTHPDDLEPLVTVRKLFFSVRNSRLRFVEGPDALNLDVRAVEVDMNPSTEWGVAIPKDSPARQVDEIGVSMRFLPDRILVSHGKIDWMGSRIHVNGTVLRSGKTTPGQFFTSKTLFPTPITEERFRSFEDQLKQITLQKGVTADIDFFVDTADILLSRVALKVNAEAVEFRGVGFSGVEILGSYVYPTIGIERMSLFQGRRSLQLGGEYHLQTRQAQGVLNNSITSGEPLRLLPESIRQLFARHALRFDQLPRFEITFGPAPAKELLNRLSGEFSIRDVEYKGIEVSGLQGRLVRDNDRITFQHLQGTVLGQEERREETGSAMQGGRASGSAFWDGASREFGVDAEINFDPHLLVRALSPVETATNIIRRFQFQDRPPEGHLTLGSNVDDWNTFYIDIQAMANDVVVQGVEFDSVHVTETYKGGKLHLDPVAATRGADFIKGSAVLDFRASTVSFDAVSSLNPADLEDLIYPRLNLFGEQIKVGGRVRIETRGVFDWKRMQQTDFSATVTAERLEVPVAVLDTFSAEIHGDGPNLSVERAEYSLYGGEGEGRFSMQWNPPRKSLPYEIDLSFSGADFNQCLAFLQGGKSVKASGRMKGNARIAADFSTPFFSSAKGEGFVQVGKGQLADLPLFDGFSRLVRRVFPAFKVFSITSLRGHFTINDGAVFSQDAYFEGDILSAKGRGSYDPGKGFDAIVQAQVLSAGRIQNMVRAITDPLMKLLEMRLEGTLRDPSWKLENF